MSRYYCGIPRGTNAPKKRKNEKQGKRNNKGSR